MFLFEVPSPCQKLCKKMYKSYSYVQNGSFSKIVQTDILSFTRDVFNLFEQYENLMMAYMFSPYGLRTREIFRKKLNRMLIDQIATFRKVKVTHLVETRIAVIVTLINVKIWYDIRTDFKHSSKDIGNAVSWAIEHLIRALQNSRFTTSKMRPQRTSVPKFFSKNALPG